MSDTATKSEDPPTIAGKAYTSRLIVGTGKYASYAQNAEAAEAAGAEIVTVALRRVNVADKGSDRLIDHLDPKRFTYLPNTAGCFTADDAAAWFDLWSKYRKAGVIPPADVGATNTGKIEEYELTRGLAAMSFANSNQVVAFQGLNKNKLAISTFPRDKGGSSGHYIKPSQMMSVSSKSKAPEEAAKLINYMVTDPEGVKFLGIERGVPCSAGARAVLAPEVDALGKMQIDYVAELTKVAVPLPPPPPKGAGEIENLLKRVADSVAFGKSSIKDGAQQFHTEAVAILARA